MADQLEVDLIVKAISENFEKIAGDLKSIEAAPKELEKNTAAASLRFTELASLISVGKMALQAFGQVAQQAFEFGREGAVIAQTTESFNGLLDQLGIGRSKLEEMRRATLGTVDDLTLMSSTLTLVAGSSDEMATAIIEAAPRLLEIAKAASKLNPTLGDTAFLYESLAKGIKRSSPMILDNLGIVVKVEEANKKFADSIGKTVEQLTAEEKTMALLNAVLEKGGTLIDQAGGNTASATDAYDAFTTELKNAANALKEELSPAIAELIPKIDGTTEKARSLGRVLADLIRAWHDTNEATIQVGDSLVSYNDIVLSSFPGLSNLYNANKALNAGLDEQARREAEAARQMELTSGELAKREMVARKARLAHQELTAAVEDEEEAEKELQQALADLNAFISGPLGNEYDKFIQRQDDLSDKMNEVQAEIDELEAKQYLTDKQREELAELYTRLDELEAQYAENAAAHEEATKRILFNILQQRAALDGLTEQEFAQLTQIAAAWDLVDARTAAVTLATDIFWREVEQAPSGTVDDLRLKFEALTTTVAGMPEDQVKQFYDAIRAHPNATLDELLELLYKIKKGVEDIPKYFKIEGAFEWINPPPKGVPPGPGGGGHGFGQRGLNMIVPPGFSEPARPFWIGVSSGEQVIVRTPAQVAAGATSGGDRFEIDQIVLQAAPGVDAERLFNQFLARLKREARIARGGGAGYLPG